MSNNLIRILHVFAELNRGGAETFIMNVYRTIDRTKMQFDFVVHHPDEGAYEQEILTLGGRIYRVPHYKIYNSSKYRSAWKRLLHEHPEWQIIHAHFYVPGYIFFDVARARGLKTIAHSTVNGNVRSIKSTVRRCLLSTSMKRADFLFGCSSEACRFQFKERSKYAFVVKNAIIVDEFAFDSAKRSDMREKLGISDKFVVGHIGRFHPQKRHSYLVDIFSIINNMTTDAVLLLVGEGNLRTEIEQKCKDLCLSERVFFTGMRSDIPDLLQAMDVFVLPSLYEGLGIVLIEAQVSGLPCVASDSVAKEAKVTDLLQFVSLNQPPEKWAEVILDKKNIPRKSHTEEIKRAGYDAVDVTEWLRKFYEEML